MTNKLIFKFKKQDLDYAKKLIEKYKLKLKEHSINLANLENINTLTKQRQIIINILQELSQEYKFFDNNVIVFFTGSYARGTVRYKSDFDLNIAYIKGSGKSMKNYEELFYNIVCQIFDLNRKYVHPVFTTFNNIKLYNIFSKKVKENTQDLKIVLMDKDNSIEYFVKGHSKKRMYLQYRNNKNLSVLLNNSYKNIKILGLQEWLFNIEILNCSDNIKNYFQKFYNKILNLSNIERYIFSLKQDILKKVNHLKHSFKNLIDLKMLKLSYQMDQLNIIYNYILLIQLNKVKEQKQTSIINFQDALIQYDSKINKLLINYLDELSSLQYMLEQNNLPFSIHINYKIHLSELTNLTHQLNKLKKLSKVLNNHIKDKIKYLN